MGAVLGAAAVGCGDDGSAEGSAGATSTSTGGSTSLADDTGSGSSDGSTDQAPPLEACAAPSGMAPEELLAEVDAIVVVMMENRSFDHYFGSSTFLEGWTVDGLTGEESNPMLDGTPVPVFPLDNLTPEDPPHGWGREPLAVEHGRQRRLRDRARAR